MAGQAPGSSRIAGTSTAFRVGWWVLLVLTFLFILNHLAGTVAFANNDDERLMFVGFAALGIVSLAVLLIPYRARESWAWWVAGPSRWRWPCRSSSSGTGSACFTWSSPSSWPSPSSRSCRRSARHPRPGRPPDPQRASLNPSWVRSYPSRS
jgi:hypothetical protein